MAKSIFIADGTGKTVIFDIRDDAPFIDISDRLHNQWIDLREQDVVNIANWCLAYLKISQRVKQETNYTL